MSEISESWKDDAFMSSEHYEHVYISLCGVYSRCMTKEEWEDNPDHEKLAIWKKRYLEIIHEHNTWYGTWKNGDWRAMWDRADQMLPELRAMNKIEEAEYFDLEKIKFQINESKQF